MPKPISPIINWNNPITKSMVANFPLYERGGAFVQDIVTKVRGDITSAIFSPDLLRTGMTFTPSGQKVTVRSSKILAGSPNLTISAIISPTTAAGATSGQCIYAERNASAGNDILVFAYSPSGSSDLLRFKYRDDAATLDQLNSSAINAVGRLSYVVVTKKGTAITFYANGVQVGTAVQTATDTFTDSLVSVIGNDPRDGNSSYGGLIDSVSLWNRTLSSSEVLSLYAKPFQIYRTPLPMPLNSGIYI